MSRYLFLNVCLLLGLISQSASSEDLTVTVYDFPPDIINSKVEPEGPLIDKVRSIMEHAGVNIHWLLSSLGEESVMLSDGTRPFCTTGRYFSYTRVEQDGWVFLPYILHSLSGDSLLVHRDNLAKFSEYKHVSEVLSSSTLKGVFIGDVHYGPDINPYLEKTPEQFNRTAKSTDQVIAMIASGRGDYTIVTDDYWLDAKNKNPQLSSVVDLGQQIQLFSVDRTYLYLTCSRGVPRPLLAKLESAMEKLGFLKSPEEIQSYQ